MGPREDLEAWVRLKVESWAHGVCTLDKTENQYLQLACAGLVMWIQIEWHYLQMNVPGVDTIMVSIEDALREVFFPALF